MHVPMVICAAARTGDARNVAEIVRAGAQVLLNDDPHVLNAQL